MSGHATADGAARPLDPWEQAYRDFETGDEEIRKFERRLHALGVDRLARSSRVLEICCGRGNALTAWERLGFRRRAGLDLSHALLRLYDGTAPRIVGDIRAMPVASASQDIVAVHGGLHHLPSLADLDATLREVARVIRPDGHVVIVEPWSTPFLTAVHALSRQRPIRALSKKMDAFERMYELERSTYDAWLGQPDTILSIVNRHLKAVVMRRRLGKLMLLARRGEPGPDVAPPAGTSRFGRMALLALTAIAIARFLAAAWSGVSMTRGDYYVTLPGPYVQGVNPTLWNSPDLADSAAFHRDYYLYGPPQYLTLYPLAYLDSYREIAMVLLVAYALVIAATIVVLWRTITAGEAGRRVGVAPAVCTALLFAPLLHSYTQREFETVVFLIWTVGASLLIKGQRAGGGAAIGYIAWFKLLPLGFLPYFVLRRWWGAVAGFVAASAVVLALAQALFGLDSFLMFSSRTLADESAATHIVGAQLRPFVEGPAGFYLDLRKSPGHLGTGFCDDWNETNETIVSVRWALCGLNLRHRWIPARGAFYLIIVSIAAAFLMAFARHERRRATPLEAKWRTIWELSIVSMVTIVIVRAHFYYLTMLLFPFVALVYRYVLYGAGRAQLALLAFSYVVLSGFVVPFSVSTAALGRDAWHVYMHYNLYFYGILTLFALLLWEYWPRPVRVQPIE